MKIYLHSLDIEDIIKIKTTLNEGEYVQVNSIITNTPDMVISNVIKVKHIIDDEIRITMENGIFIDIKYPYDKYAMIY